MDIKTKFDIGDKVWTIDNNNFYRFTIKNITCEVYRNYENKLRVNIAYDDGTHESTYDYYNEHRVAATKEELLNLLS